MTKASTQETCAAQQSHPDKARSYLCVTSQQGNRAVACVLAFGSRERECCWQKEISAATTGEETRGRGEEGRQGFGSLDPLLHSTQELSDLGLTNM